MLPTIILALSGLAVAVHADALAHLVPRQTISVDLDKSDPCFTKVSSVEKSYPTLPAQYLKWASSLTATASDICEDFVTPTGTYEQMWASWTSDTDKWRSDHTSELASLTSECRSFLKSRLDAGQSSWENNRSSCQAKHSATETSASATTGDSTSEMTTTATGADATQTDSSGARGVSLAGYGVGMLAVSLSVLHLL